MGIKGLNSYINNNCKNALSCIHFNDITGKKIVIDASIYIYRFLGDNALVEKMFQLINLFKYYNIIPIFIFDGKPPELKQDIINIRKERKNKAYEKYNELVTKGELKNIEKLKKQFLHIKNEDINTVKTLLANYGIMYYNAPYEADELCALLVKKGIAWACLSEDMDLFAYGCPRVLRYLSLIQKNFILYDTAKIINNLKLSLYELKLICTLSNNDFSGTSNSIINVLGCVNKYKSLIKDSIREEKIHDFYNYLTFSNINIKLMQFDDIIVLLDYFNCNKDYLKVFEKQQIKYNKINYTELRDILVKNNFIIP